MAGDGIGIGQSGVPLSEEEAKSRWQELSPVEQDRILNEAKVQGIPVVVRGAVRAIPWSQLREDEKNYIKTRAFGYGVLGFLVTGTASVSVPLILDALGVSALSLSVVASSGAVGAVVGGIGGAGGGYYYAKTAIEVARHQSDQIEQLSIQMASAEVQRRMDEAQRRADEAQRRADEAQARPREGQDSGELQHRANEAQRRADEAQRRADEIQRRVGGYQGVIQVPEAKFQPTSSQELKSSDGALVTAPGGPPAPIRAAQQVRGAPLPAPQPIGSRFSS